MAKLGLIGLERVKKGHGVKLLLTSDGEMIGNAYLRFWGCVAILVSLDLLPEAKEKRSCHFEEWLIGQVVGEAKDRHCSRLIVYKNYPTPEERKLYERLGFKKSIYGFCQSFSYLY